MIGPASLEDGSEAIKKPSVSLPSQGIPNHAIAIGAILSGILLFFVIRSDGEPGQPRLLERTSQAPIVEPPPLYLPRDSDSSGVAQLGSSAPQEPFPRSSLAQRPEPLPRRSRADDVEEPVYSDEIARAPQPPDFYQSPEQTPVFEPVRDEAAEAIPALVIDRGIRRAKGRRPETGFATQNPNGGSAPLRPEPANLTPTLLQAGTLIPAVLETALDTSRPSVVRAMVTKDVRGYDGSQILVPKGSRLIGRYASDVSAGQDRVLVTWTKLILLDGRQVSIENPSIDRKGVPGIEGDVHDNSFGRILGSVFQTALNIATFRASQSSSNSSIILATPGGLSNITQDILPTQSDRRKITVPAGEPLAVFVSQDIDFAAMEADPVVGG